jgi:hypothetical protein
MSNLHLENSVLPLFGSMHLKIVSSAIVLMILLAGCDIDRTTSHGEDLESEEIHAIMDNLMDKKLDEGVASKLAEVRRVTAAYHNFDKASEDGWFIPLSPCISNPDLGGMGYHYGNPAYLGNGILDPLMPEALLYEPKKNGRLRLVGVEYIVPFGAPETTGGDPIEGDQPFLFGQGFDNSPHVGPNGSWTLHVWVWRHNPAGMFAAFNPKVTCDYAP